MIGVSFDPVTDLQAFRNAEGLRIGLASDPGQALARSLGLLHENVVQGKHAFFPTKVLIDPADNRVLWAFAEDDLRVREGPRKVLAAIDALTR